MITEPRRLAGAPGAWGRAAALLFAIVVAATACASARPGAAGLADGHGVAAAGFAFGRDTFAFRNEIRSRHPDAKDLYANYCFVLARGLRQFLAGARFDAGAPRLTHEEYVERVQRVAARPPWREPLPPQERVVIPGYGSLREFSRAEEAAVKEGLGGRFWTLVHWTNWRITWPVTGGHQEGVAADIVDDLARGRLVQLLVTNWPKPELNHTVIAYAARTESDGLAFTVWDPNDPERPGRITFDPTVRRFVATRVYDTEPGVIRVFRMYHSWLL